MRNKVEMNGKVFQKNVVGSMVPEPKLLKTRIRHCAYFDIWYRKRCIIRTILRIF